MQSSGVGALGRLSRTSMPSLSNSPQMQGAPRSALAEFLWRAGHGFRHSSWVVRYGAIVRTSRCTFAVPFDHGRPRGRMQ
jgi:hypothetical protein